MAQDIRELLKKHQPEKETGLSPGHEARFEAMLDRELGSSTSRRPGFYWMRIAAVAVVAFGLGYFGFQQLSADQAELGPAVVDAIDDRGNTTTPGLTLGDISPDLKKIEDFYTNGINVQLASLETDDENRELIDGYMLRLEELSKEYNTLNVELNEFGPTEATITALIDNLKLRLELLFRLKNKLQELKDTNNEQLNEIQA